MDHRSPDASARFEALAAEVYEPLQRYVRRRVAAEAVDDVVADTMLVLWRRVDEIPVGAAVPWAYGVARRQLANHRRAAGRRLRLVRRIEAEPQSPVVGSHPLDAELDAALCALSGADREILRLWAWEGLEPTDIGVALEITPNAAAIRLHRAKKKLRDELMRRKDPASGGHAQGERRKEERL
ncbi:MAG TPA: sigma-70 family RNA polymerase sigma factor [Acidimicrobiia bacterium]